MLDEEWHTAHEDIASALQGTRDLATVDSLFAAAGRRLPYLDDDEALALAVKRLWGRSTTSAQPRPSETLKLRAEWDVPVIRESVRAAR